MTEDTEKVAKQVIDFVNNYGCDYKLFAQHITRAHRTLQQSSFRLFVECILEWSKQDNCDLRNEATVKVCKEIVKVMGDKLYLPYI